MQNKNNIVVHHSDGFGKQPKTITSLEIAEISGKSHDNLLKSIKKQEVGWEKVTGVKFNVSKYKDKSGKMNNMYRLTKMESLFISSKFNDEIRARLILRWFELEHQEPKNAQLSEKAGSYSEQTLFTVKMGSISNQVWVQDGVLYAKLVTIMKYIDYEGFSAITYIDRIGKHNLLKVSIGKQNVWFINLQGFDNIINQIITRTIPYSKIGSILYDVFGENREKDTKNPYTYQFTDSEMLEIYQTLNARPIKKGKLNDLLTKGKI